MNREIPEFAKSMHDNEYDTPYHIRPVQAENLLDPFDREKISLNGKWHYCIDQYDTGFRKEWYHLKDIDNNGNRVPVDIDFDYWEETTIPSCINNVSPSFLNYEGSVWYTKTFRADFFDSNRRYFIFFEGASYETRVWLNEHYICRHLGGSTPFCVEITEFLLKENRILISVNNERKNNRVPALNTDWFNYGGLYREINIYSTPKAFVKRCFARLVPDGSYDKVEIDVNVCGELDCCTISIPELSVKITVPIENGKAHTVLHVYPVLWSPDCPKLYKLVLKAGEDVVTDEIGFREIIAKGKEVYLNGKPLFLRGISFHEDNPTTGKSLSEKQVDDILNLCSELNCNFIRLAHYPHSRYTSKKADRLGFILWEEIPVYWAINFKDEETLIDAENQLNELIFRDINRASCCFWSVGNENPDTDERLKFMTRLVEICHKLDETRLVAAACLVNYSTFAVEDRLTEVIDIVGINEYFGWYRGNMDQLSCELDAFTINKPLIITEFGADALAGYHDQSKPLFSEEFQMKFYQEQLDTILSKGKIVCGFTPWILFDFRSPRRWNRFQKGYNRKGLVSEDILHKKLAFGLLAERYRIIKESE